MYVHRSRIVRYSKYSDDPLILNFRRCNDEIKGSDLVRSIDQAAILGINGSKHNLKLLDPRRKLMTQVTRSTLEKFTAVLVDDFQCGKLTLCQPESHSSVECASLQFESSAEQI